MDVVLEFADGLLLDRLYSSIAPAPSSFASSSNSSHATAELLQQPYQYKPASRYLSLAPGAYVDGSALARDDPIRQALSLFAITCIMGTLLYFVFATLSYYFVFDHLTFKHPRFLKNQVSLEIKQSLSSVPGMAVLTVPFFMLEVRGYTKMYDHTSEGPGFWYDIAQFPLFFMFTDFGIYWIHRGLHHPLIYKHLHKAHHKWIMPTPYAAIAFHPVDGWAQSLPYHLYPLLFPMQKWAYVFVFIFVQLWTIMIHDGEYVANNPIINGSACHSVHHFAFNYNYGQYFTIWDRIGGSYRKPAEELFNKETKMSQSTWKNQTKEADAMLKDVEGEDSRVYGGDAKKTQ